MGKIQEFMERKESTLARLKLEAGELERELIELVPKPLEKWKDFITNSRYDFFQRLVNTGECYSYTYSNYLGDQLAPTLGQLGFASFDAAKLEFEKLKTAWKGLLLVDVILQTPHDRTDDNDWLLIECKAL